MRKHFLLLFLMALLPLAGWAATLEDATIIVNDMVYGGTAPVVFKVQIGAVELSASTDYTADYSKFYRDEACTDLVKDEDQNPVAAAALPAGSYYYIKVSGAGENYSGSKGGKFFVNKKPITLDVTLPTGFKVTYDGTTHTNEAMPAGTTYALASGSTLATGENLQDVVTGDLKLTYAATSANKTAADTPADITGKTAAAITFSGLSADNYEINYSARTVDVYQFKIIDGDGKLVNGVSIASTGNNVIYNSVAQTPTYTVTFNGTALDATAFAANFEVTLTSAVNSNKNAGNATFKIVAKAGGNFYGEYAGLEAVGDQDTYKMTIQRAAAFIKAAYQSREYDGNKTEVATDLYVAATATDPANVEWTGVYDADAASFGTPSLHLEKEAKDAGEYKIIITAPTAGWGNDNYVVGIDNTGIYEITKKTLTITANDKTVAFGAAQPTFTVADVTISGNISADLTNLKKGISAKFVDGFNYASQGAGVFENVIEPTVDDTKAAATFKNYKWDETLVKGKLTINAAQILIAIKAREKFYGEDDPEDLSSSYIISGATAGLLTPPVIKRAEGEDAAEYLMSIETEATAKPGYEILYATVPVKFTIKKAQLYFTIPSQNVVTGDKKDALKKDNIDVEGINNDDVAEDLYELDFNTGVTLGTGDDAGKITDENKTYATGIKATLTTAAQANYEIVTDGTTTPVTTAVYTTGKLIVNNGTGGTLNLATAADVADNIAALDAEVSSAVTMPNLALNEKEWYAVVLPFATTPAELVQELGVYVVVDRIKSSSINAAGVVTVNFEMEWDEIPAGEPFLVKPAAAKNLNATSFTDKLVVKNITAKATDNATFTGTYATGQSLLWGKDLDGTDKEGAAYRWLAHKEYNNDNNWKNPKSNVHPLAPMEAYLVLDPAATRARIFVEDLDDNGTTAIKELGVDGTNKAYSVDGWYTLNGVKLQAAPTAKGVYINNGKKVVIK